MQVGSLSNCAKCLLAILDHGQNCCRGNHQFIDCVFTCLQGSMFSIPPSPDTPRPDFLVWWYSAKSIRVSSILMLELIPSQQLIHAQWRVLCLALRAKLPAKATFVRRRRATTSSQDRNPWSMTLKTPIREISGRFPRYVVESWCHSVLLWAVNGVKSWLYRSYFPLLMWK